MTSITISDVDDELRSRLLSQAAVHGRSIEDEAREILASALQREPARKEGLADAIRARFAPVEGFDLPAIPREPARDPPPFSE